MILRANSASDIQCWGIGMPLSVTSWQISYYKSLSRVNMSARSRSDLFLFVTFCKLFDISISESYLFDRKGFLITLRSDNWSSRI